MADPDIPVETPPALARPVRVAIVEDQPLIREGLAALIGGSPGFEVAGRYRTMEEALAGVRHPLPHVVLLDIGLPGISGIEGVRRLRLSHPGLPVLMLTVYDDDQRVFDALCAGACGYLLKKTPPLRLLEGLVEVAGGGAPMSPEIARRVVALFHKVRPPERADYRLTPHETRLLKLLCEGHSCKSAAAELQLTIHAVSYHMRRIYEKLEVHSKSAAVAKAMRERLT
jgi:DNA-binding NarL/FixJ family response regulator